MKKVLKFLLMLCLVSIAFTGTANSQLVTVNSYTFTMTDTVDKHYFPNNADSLRSFSGIANANYFTVMVLIDTSYDSANSLSKLPALGIGYAITTVGRVDTSGASLDSTTYTLPHPDSSQVWTFIEPDSMKFLNSNSTGQFYGVLYTFTPPVCQGLVIKMWFSDTTGKSVISASRVIRGRLEIYTGK